MKQNTTMTRVSAWTARIKRGLLVTGAIVPAIALTGAAHAATLTTASVNLSDPRPSAASTSYDFLASNVSGTALKCIKEVYSSNADGSGTVPNTTTAASVNTASSSIFSSHTGWLLDKTTNGTLKYTNSGSTTAPSITSGAHFVVDGITNGGTANTPYYLTVSTYTAADCSSGPVDNVVVQFVYTNGQQVTIGVDPSLSFSVAGVTGDGTAAVNGTTITNTLATTPSTIPFGTISSSTNKVAAQDLTVSTNSGLGYTVYTRYTAKPTSGSYTIDDLSNASASNASPQLFSAAGTEAFGYTTNDTTLSGSASRFSGNKWAPFTATNAEIAYNGAPVANQTTRVGVQAGVSGSTEPGSYTTTVIYTATPVY